MINITKILYQLISKNGLIEWMRKEGLLRENQKWSKCRNEIILIGKYESINLNYVQKIIFLFWKNSFLQIKLGLDVILQIIHEWYRNKGV